MTNRRELADRLEAAECGSRELDGDVAEATVGFMEWDGSPITTSLDAALALAERVLPRWYWRAGKTPHEHWHHGRYTNGWAHLSRTDASNCDRGDEATGWACTPALALCAAILRARLDAEGRGGEGDVE